MDFRFPLQFSGSSETTANLTAYFVAMMRAIFKFDGAGWAHRHQQPDPYLDIESGDPIVEFPVAEATAQGWKFGMNLRTAQKGWFPPGWAYPVIIIT